MIPAGEYKALSLWQPWASLIADQRKLIETRHWHPPGNLIGRWIAIHATKKVVKDAALRFGYTVADLPTGAVVCIAFLESWLRFTPENTEYISDDEKRCGDFAEGRFGWKFCEIRKLATPFEARGGQGIFRVSLPSRIETI